jgi:signal transduction histidine kinase
MYMTARDVSDVTKLPSQPRFSLSRILLAAQQEATGTKTTSYMLTTILAGSLYALVSLMILQGIPASWLIPAWIGLSFAFAIAFSPLRYGAEEIIRQLFPYADYNSHQLIKRLNAISYSSLTLERLTTHFFQELEINLSVNKALFLTLDKDGNRTTRLHGFDSIPDLDPLEVLELSKATHQRPADVSHIRPDHLRHKLESHDIKVVVPLTNNENLLGLLILGPKDNQHGYTTKDLKVLGAIAPKVGYAIQNTREYERVSTHNQELITNLENANQKLREMNDKLKHDDKLKDEFIYVATHELKNPVTAMRGYLSLIEEGRFGPIPDTLKTPLDQVLSSNQQLITLLNNLLQIARIEATTISFTTKPIAICEVIDQVTRDLKALADQKNLTITHDYANPSITVIAEKERLREIISNLISNAIKYSDKGTIEITHEIDKDVFVTHVKDEGVGISEKDQKMIFTRFFRVEEEAAKGIPGTGLGLFIIKELIQRMEGKIWFTSKLGTGSVFSFSLPLARTYTFRT